MNIPPPEITDPLLKSLVDEAAHLPRMAALEARKSRERNRSQSPHAARRTFHPLPGIVWLLQFRAAQAALALLLLAAMVEGGSVLTGERFPMDAPRKKGVDLLSAATVTTRSGQEANVAISSSGPDSGASSGTLLYDVGASSDEIATTGNPVPVTANVYERFANNTSAVSTSADSGATGGGTFDPNQIYEWDLAQGGGDHKEYQRYPGHPATTNLSPVLGDAIYNGVDKVVTLNSGRLIVAAPGTTSVFDSGIAGVDFTADSGTGNIAVNITGGSGTGSAAEAGDLGVNLASTYYSRGILQGPQAKAGDSIGTVHNGILMTGTVALSSTGADNQSTRITVQDGKESETTRADSYGISIKGGSASGIFNGGSTDTRIISGTLHDVTAYSGPATLLNGTSAYNDRLYSNVDEYFWSSGTTPKGARNGVLMTGTVAGNTKTIGPKSLIDPAQPFQTLNFKPQHPYVSGAKSDKGTPSVVIDVNGQTTTSGGKPGVAAVPAGTPAPVVDTRKLIRNAALDFEVGSFEKGLDTITAVAGEEQGYVFSQSSAKGANGKLQGQVIVKVLPPNLDRFLLKLRLLGDMKNQTVSAVDVSKDYYDTEAHIRNSQVTEERLIEMMKTRTGKVSDLLEVENEIAKVRGEIEQMQGSLKVYDAQVQFATVTITLQEKDINQAAAYLLKQQAQLSLFAKDVTKAFGDANSAAAAAKAQTLDSHMERDAAGHEVATLHLLIPPDASEEAIAKLKGIGRIEHFNSQTQRVAKDDGSDIAPSDTAKMDRDKVELNLVIQQDAENPVQGTNISVQTEQVEAKTDEIKKAAADHGIEVKGAEFNRLRNGVEVSAMLLRMPMSKYGAFIEQIKALGKVKDFTVARREDSTATGDAPAEIALQIFSQGSIVAPETGLWVTIRHTLGEGMGALMWSVRMIGVSLAWITPWAAVVGLVAWVGLRRRRNRAARKQS